MADDLGYADVDWKDTNLFTPNLRKYAFHENSAYLTNSYVSQLCTPTRSAFMTGYYPFRTGTQNGVFLHMEPAGVPLMFPFIPENLKPLGYSTYLIGKWHLGYCRKEFLPTNRGFDYFYGFYGPQAGYFNHSADLFEEPGDGKSIPDFSKNGVYSTDLFTNVTIDMIKNHDRSKPWFMWLSYQAVHPPLQVPRFYERYCSKIKDRSRKIYCGMLTAMDFAIDRLINYLKEADLYNNTIIIFTSDNGGTVQFGASNAPLRGEKDTLWDGGTRTTTFIHSPKFIKKGGDRNMFFHVVDWHATLLDIAGMKINSYGDGINQWDYIKTGKAKLRRFQFIYNIDVHGSAIRDGDYKLILGNPSRKTRTDEGRVRLFKLSADPTESNDISRTNPKIVKRLLAKLKELKSYMHKNVRKPLTLLGSPERFNGTYASDWCNK